jgi:hypothetical protein
LFLSLDSLYKKKPKKNVADLSKASSTSSTATDKKQEAISAKEDAEEDDDYGVEKVSKKKK